MLQAQGSTVFDFDAFATWLTARRFRLGLTQSDLAELMGGHQPDVSDYESGKKRPSLETILLLIDVLGQTNSRRAFGSFLKNAEE